MTSVVMARGVRGARACVRGHGSQRAWSGARQGEYSYGLGWSDVLCGGLRVKG